MTCRPTGWVARSPWLSGKTTPACDSGVVAGALRRRFTSAPRERGAQQPVAHGVTDAAVRGQHGDDDLEAGVVGGPQRCVQGERVLAGVAGSGQAHVVDVGHGDGRQGDQPEGSGDAR